MFNVWTRRANGVGALGDSVFSWLSLECPVPRICSFVWFRNMWTYASMFRSKDHEGILPPGHRQILQHQPCTYQRKISRQSLIHFEKHFTSLYNVFLFLNQQSDYKVFYRLMGLLWVKLVDVLAWWCPLQRGDLIHRVTVQLAKSVWIYCTGNMIAIFTVVNLLKTKLICVI